jgi:hypothetical protein
VGIVDDAEGGRRDVCGCRINALVAGQWLREAVFKLARPYKMLVRDPRPGWPLSGHNGTKGVLHCPSLKGVTIFGKATISEALCNALKVWDWVCDRCQQ